MDTAQVPYRSDPRLSAREVLTPKANVTNGDRTPEVRQCLEELSLMVDCLEEQIKRLAERITPVLRQTEEPSPAHASPPDTIVTTQVGTRIRSLRDQVRTLSHAVLALNSRIEV